MKNACFFAVDLGATSGRTIVGCLSDQQLELQQLTRFPNTIIQVNGHYYWDIYALYGEIVKGLKEAADRQIPIRSIGIDTWGVDFVFIGKDGELLRTPYSYRDTQTVGAPEAYFKEISRREVYGLTGIQIMNFNSLYQLHALYRHGCSALAAADKILFMPDALGYMLTGKMTTEYTIASTSQMLNPRTKNFEDKLLDAAGVKSAQFAPIVLPGTRLGVLTDEVQKQTGLGAIPIVSVAGHDTASAVASVPAVGERFAYLSSGTWSLMGIEIKEPIINEESLEKNFTNEGGVEGTVRFLKNICGMWLLERCRAERPVLREYGYDELNRLASASPAFRSLINPDAPCFANPKSMPNAIRQYCEQTEQPVPDTDARLTRCIFDSLALRYKQVFKDLQQMAPFPIERLHIIGGGSKNELLDQFASNALGIPVTAGPTEGTAIGNLMMQAKADGIVATIEDMRALIRASAETRSFEPQDNDLWEAGYRKYLTVYRDDL